MIHVEKDREDGVSFCGVFALGQVSMQDWQREPEVIQRATCPECLLRLFMLGDHAQIALAKMGMKVDVHNEESIH